MPMSTSDARAIGGISGATDPMTSHSSRDDGGQERQAEDAHPGRPSEPIRPDSSTSHAQLCRNSGGPRSAS